MKTVEERHDRLVRVARQVIRRMEGIGEDCLCGEVPSVHRLPRGTKLPAHVRRCPFAALVRAVR